MNDETYLIRILAEHIARQDGAIVSLTEDVRFLLGELLRTQPDAFDRWQNRARDRVTRVRAEAAEEATGAATMRGVAEASERLLTVVPPIPPAWAIFERA